MHDAPPQAGWYDDPITDGIVRWWDGTQWTHHTRRPPTPVPPAVTVWPAAPVRPPAPDATDVLLPVDAANAVAPNGDPAGRPWWQRKRVFVPVGVLLLAAAVSTVGDTGEPTEAGAGGSVETEEAALDQIDPLIGQPDADESVASTQRPTTSRSTTSRPTTTGPRSTTTTATTAEERQLDEDSSTRPTAAVEDSTTALPSTTATTARPTTTAPTTTVQPTTSPPTTAPTTVATTTSTTSGCDPNYSGACVPIASDVDCLGGSGNGPAYVRGPVTVIGTDIYGLDRDGDGIGCEP